MKALASLALVGLLAAPARAEGEPVPPPRVSAARRVLAVGAAVVPGVVFRGVGSYLVGEERAAKRLAITGGVGLAAILAGGALIAGSGASEYTIPAVPLVVLGAGLFFPTWFSDVAVAAGLAPTAGVARAPSVWSLELGTLWLNDPYRSRGLGTVAARAELGRLGLGAGAMLDSEGVQDTEELEARWRIFGAPPTGRLLAAGFGDRLLVAVAARRHRDDQDDVTLQTAELEVRGRFELAHLDHALRGQFFDGNVGVGVERAGYPRGEHDVSSVLLAGFGYGLYLGEGSELSFFYDHRRDSMAGGIAAGRAAGFVGSVGGRLVARVDPHWAVRGEVQVGNAWLWSLGLRYEGF